MTNYRERLYQLRKRYSLTQRDLAKTLGISRQAVSRWETEENEPSEENLDQICSTFHLSKEYFFCAKFDPAYLDESYFPMGESAASEGEKGGDTGEVLAEIALADSEPIDSAEAEIPPTDVAVRGSPKRKRTKRFNRILMISSIVDGIFFIISLIVTIILSTGLLAWKSYALWGSYFNQENCIYLLIGCTVVFFILEVILICLFLITNHKSIEKQPK